MTINETPFSGREVELVPGFLRGYRAWNRVFSGGQPAALRSTAIGDYAWEKGRNTAHCNLLRYAEIAAAQNLLDVSVGPLGCGCFLCRNAYGSVQSGTLEKLRAHGIPSGDCPECNQCGFYALHTVDMFGDVVQKFIPQLRTANLTFGTIKATGRVIIGELGFRAQYAEIEALCGELARPFAEMYGVPWIPGGLQELADAFPPTRVEGVNYDYQSREDDVSITGRAKYSASTTGITWNQFWGVDPAKEQTE